MKIFWFKQKKKFKTRFSCTFFWLGSKEIFIAYQLLHVNILVNFLKKKMSIFVEIEWKHLDPSTHNISKTFLVNVCKIKLAIYV